LPPPTYSISAQRKPCPPWLPPRVPRCCMMTTTGNCRGLPTAMLAASNFLHVCSDKALSVLHDFLHTQQQNGWWFPSDMVTSLSILSCLGHCKRLLVKLKPISSDLRIWTCLCLSWLAKL
jgi:hypothetical protein